jgi:hypothetical protein
MFILHEHPRDAQNNVVEVNDVNLFSCGFLIVLNLTEITEICKQKRM